VTLIYIEELPLMWIAQIMPVDFLDEKQGFGIPDIQVAK
jgi:hypothetical protein